MSGFIINQLQPAILLRDVLLMYFIFVRRGQRSVLSMIYDLFYILKKLSHIYKFISLLTKVKVCIVDEHYRTDVTDDWMLTEILYSISKETVCIVNAQV